ncbi:MAG: zinc-ribbon domain-containing protein [Deltaproteobacteria bacterium]|jgi:hypothetical protein|nr:zinc-ribbon domain-containing protein [Deltaproteobacteria bacterium]
MALIQCPECGKEISDKAVACPGCGNPIASETRSGLLSDGENTQEIKLETGIKIETLLGMARTADTAGNFSEAENYYTRVLESDPELSEAWFRKGRAAAWQSTMANMRLG